MLNNFLKSLERTINSRNSCQSSKISQNTHTSMIKLGKFYHSHQLLIQKPLRSLLILRMCSLKLQEQISIKLKLVWQFLLVNSQAIVKVIANTQLKKLKFFMKILESLKFIQNFSTMNSMLN